VYNSVNTLDYSELIRMRPISLHSSNYRDVRGSLYSYIIVIILFLIYNRRLLLHVALIWDFVVSFTHAG